jgi:glycosyltransferase involved in cell wall biosynthesis
MIEEIKPIVEWNSYEMPSYGFPEFEEKKKYGIVGGLGVVSDEVLPRIAKEVNVYGIGMRHLRGRDLPNIEEIDGYSVFRPYGSLSREESLNKCRTLFGLAGFDFNGVHQNEVTHLPFIDDYSLMIPKVRTHETPDLICAHDWMAILGSYEKSLNLRVPLVVFLHSLEPGRAGGMIHTLTGPQENCHSGVYGGSRTVRDIEAIGIAKADIVFTVGKNMVEEVKKVGVMHGISSKDIEKKIYPIHHGVDTKTYRPLTGINKEFDIIFIGRFAPVKGLMELIDAVSILKSKYPDIKVRLIGGGELEKDLEERVKREALEKNVLTSTRWVPPKEKAAEINRAKIAIAPSKYEPHGQFDLEAGACGVPCINGTGGFMERMLDNITALQCNPFSPKDIAEKIDSLLSHEERIEEIGKNARDFINKYYGWAERASIYPEIFRSIIEDDLKSLNELPLVVPLENEFSSPSFSGRRIKAKTTF